MRSGYTGGWWERLCYMYISAISFKYILPFFWSKTQMRCWKQLILADSVDWVGNLWCCHSIAERQAKCLSSNSPLSQCDPTEILYVRPGGGVLVLRANLQVGFFWYRPNGWGLLGASVWFRKVFGSQQNTRRSQVPSCWVRTLACICRK